MDNEVKTEDTETLKRTDKKCENCGGTMVFNPQSGKLLCEYCGTERDFNESDEDSIAQEIDFDDAEFKGNHDWGVETKRVICKNCGAESIYDALQIADVCPYCGSVQVMEAGSDDAVAPNGVCPFEITDRQAKESFGKWMKHRIFAPNIVRRNARVNKFRGIYLPYWTFDADSSSSYTARYGIDHTVTRDGKTHTETDWYYTSGNYKRFFDDILISATNRYNPKVLSKIEPFDTAGSKEYKPEFLSGYLAERYTIGLNDAWSKGKTVCNSIIKSEVTSEIRRCHNADRVDRVNISTLYDNLKYKYLMLPVWMSSFEYKKKIYSYFVNGQTGKAGGKCPVSPWKVLIACGIGIAILAIIFGLFALSGNV